MSVQTHSKELNYLKNEKKKKALCYWVLVFFILRSIMIGFLGCSLYYE